MTLADMDALDHLSRPRVGLQRLLIALLQGALLVVLYRAFVDKVWPATVPMLFIPLVLTLILCPVLLVASLGHLPRRRIVQWVGGAVLLVAALGVYDGWRTVELAVRGAMRAPSPLLFVHLVAALFIAHTLVVAASAEQRRIASYPTYFDAAWKLAVQLVFSAGFVGAVWVVLGLGAVLFKLIRLDFLAHLMERAWFNIPVAVFAFTCAVHITDVRPAIVRGIRSLILVLMSWLLPVVTLLVGGFLVSLPFTGLAPLWATRHATATLLGVAAMLVIMINAAWQNGAALATTGPHRSALPVRWSARLAALLLAPLVAIAAFALALRVADYGWTDERIVACACIVVASCYAAGYGLAAVRSAALARLGAVNIGTAFVVVAVIVALFSPLLDPARLSVGNQVARLLSGKVTADKFDFSYLRFSGQRFGQAALDRLNVHSAGPQAAAIRAGAARALAQENRWTGAPALLPAQALQANLTVWPQGAALPPGFIESMGEAQGRRPGPPCLYAAGPRCDVFLLDLSGSGTPDLLVLGKEKFGEVAIVHQGEDRVWRISQMLSPALSGCSWFRERLIAGQYRLVPPASRVLEIDGHQFAPQRYELNEDGPCLREKAK